MSYTQANISKRKFDVVIVGAGGSGMRAALELSRDVNNSVRKNGAVLGANSHADDLPRNYRVHVVDSISRCDIG